MPAVTAATPKPCRSPLGEAGTPSSPAASITACTARHPVIDHGQSRTPRPLPRWPAASQQAPPLAAVAQMHSTTSLSLHAFLLTPHPSMPNYRLAPKEVDDVVAYILSLRQPH